MAAADKAEDSVEVNTTGPGQGPKEGTVARILKGYFTRGRLFRYGVAALAIVAAAWFLIYLGQIGVYNLAVAQAVAGPLLKGLTVTLELIALVIPIGFTMGFLMGWARTTQSSFLRGLGAVYVDFFRSMPPLALIAFAYLITLLPLHDLVRDPGLQQLIPRLIGTIALGLHSGAYQAEIFRAGILSVPTGQHEAADAVGLSGWQSMFRIVFPQAVRVSLPPLGNEFSSVIKDTSLLNAIGFYDLSGIALTIGFGTATQYNYPIFLTGILIWVEAAILYFIITFAVNRIVRAVENHYKVPGLEAAQA